MIYYTPAFEAIENDIEGYVSTIMSEINQGYENTGVDLNAELHCIAPANVDDMGDSGDVLLRFRDAFSKKEVNWYCLLVENFNTLYFPSNQTRWLIS